MSKKTREKMLGSFEEFLYWEAASKDTIDVKKAYIDIAGDLAAGVMLSQIIFWYLPKPNQGLAPKLRVKKEGVLWLVKGYKDWWAEIRLTEKQARRALKVLTDKGLVEIKIRRFNGSPTCHIRIQNDKFLSLLEENIRSRCGE